MFHTANNLKFALLHSGGRNKPRGALGFNRAHPSLFNILIYYQP